MKTYVYTKTNKKTVSLVNFVHVPRTSGTAFTDAVYNTSRDTQKTRQNILLKTIDKNYIRLIKYIHNRAIDYPNESLKIAFIRNPYDRFLSIFSYLKEGAKYNPIFPNGEKYMQQLLHKYKTPTDLITANAKDRTYIFDAVHFKPMVYFLYDDNKRLVVNYIGITEKAQESVLQICKLLNIKPIKMEKLNASKSKYTLTPKDKQFIKKYYRDDFVLYNKMTNQNL